MEKQLKPEFYCEECGFKCDSLTTVKKLFLFCKECAEAHIRRERFKREEIEWNRVPPKKQML